MTSKHVRIVLAVSAGSALVLVVPPSLAAADSGAATFTTKLSGAKVFPGPGDPDGSGEFTAITTKRTLCYTLSTKRIGMAMMAHLHAGKHDEAGPHVAMLMTPDEDGVAECVTAVPDDEDTEDALSESELASIAAHPKRYYVNVHSMDYPDGAVRGQLHRR
jgi:hypothetical protein